MQPLFHGLERAFLFRHTFAVALQPARDILCLDRERCATPGEGVEIRIDSGHRLELGCGRGEQVRGAGSLGGFGCQRIQSPAGTGVEGLQAAQALPAGE